MSRTQGADILGPLFDEELADGSEGTASVEDVIDDEDVFPGDIEGGGVEDAGPLIGGCLAGITGDGHHIDLHPNGKVAHEVGKEDDGTGEEGHENEFPTIEIRSDLLGNFEDARLDRVAVDEDLLEVFLHGGSVAFLGAGVPWGKRR